MTTPSVSTIMPGLRYRDAPNAIDWLCNAFGFARHAVYPDEQGGIAHAQLTYGGGMIMLGSIRENSEFHKYLVQPEDVGGRATQSTYVLVPDCKAHYERAKAAGARIVVEYAEKDYGGAGYSCSDPEGHLWSFGSYDPWSES